MRWTGTIFNNTIRPIMLQTSGLAAKNSIGVTYYEFVLFFLSYFINVLSIFCFFFLRNFLLLTSRL